MTDRLERDAHGLVSHVETSGVALDCRPDSHNPHRPWVLRLSHGRRMRLGTLELDKLSYVLGLVRAVEERGEAA